MTFQQFYITLENHLPQSTGTERQQWVRTIIENDFDILELSSLIDQEPKIATRFLWMLTGIAMQQPQKLHAVLPALFEKSKHITHVDMQASFANYWRFCGVPPENEAEAIELLFHWLQSAQTNVTIKSRALFVLSDLVDIYPDLKNELRLSIEDQLDKNTKDFRSRALKILEKLNQ